jgi:hypothetical protein
MPVVKTYYRAFTTGPLGQIDLIDSLKVENFTKSIFRF